MILRPYRPADCPVLAQLFFDTVHTVNARDYSPEALEAWADGQVDLPAWNERFLAHTSLVAEEAGEIVGFADMDEHGYLDRLYVHRDLAWPPLSATPWRPGSPRRAIPPTRPSPPGPFLKPGGIG